jgi:hypothetical protein
VITWDIAKPITLPPTTIEQAMKIPNDSARVLTTEDVKGIVLFFMEESWGEGSETNVPAWEAFLNKRDLEAFDAGFAHGAEHGPAEAWQWLGRSQPTETGN